MTALSESLLLTLIHDVFSLSIPTYFHFSWVRKPILDNGPLSCVRDMRIGELWLIVLVYVGCTIPKDYIFTPLALRPHHVGAYAMISSGEIGLLLSWAIAVREKRCWV